MVDAMMSVFAFLVGHNRWGIAGPHIGKGNGEESFAEHWD